MKLMITFLTVTSLISSATLSATSLSSPHPNSNYLANKNEILLNNVASTNSNTVTKFEKLKNDKENDAVHDLARKLNVIINIISHDDKSTISWWLTNYEYAANKAFNAMVASNGLGFEIKLSDLPNGYIDFLDPVDYINSNTAYNINEDKLGSLIYTIASNQLNTTLIKLGSSKYKINITNVADKNTLEIYTTWFNNYLTFLNDNAPIIYNDLANIVNRGFGTNGQKKQILVYMWKYESILHHLKNITWSNNKYFSNPNFDYKNLVLTDSILNAAIKWADYNFPEINKQYQAYLLKAESDVYMHGYSLAEVLGDNTIPKTKDQIDNYMNGKSFSQWLQQEADGKYHQWQIKISLSIAIPLFFLIFSPIAYFYIWYTNKYNPKEYRIYKRLNKIDQQRYKQKKKRWWNFK